ncbi:MAG: hypothetical protein V5A43_05315 [Haloarculaceae archaeon]
MAGESAFETEVSPAVTDFVDGYVESVRGDAEQLAEEGGITADTRGNLAPPMLLRLLRWRFAQGTTLYSRWAGDPDPDYPALTREFSWKAGEFSRLYEDATDLLERKTDDPEDVEFGIQSESMTFLAALSTTAERVAIGLVVAPSFRKARDQQADMIAEANAALRSMKLFRESVIPSEEETISRGTMWLARLLENGATGREDLDAAATEFFDLARRVQEENMDAAGDVDPSAIC